jgi:hypothetical protein
MAVTTVPLRIDMRGDTQMENVTKLVQNALATVNAAAGIVTIFVKHTTASPASERIPQPSGIGRFRPILSGSTIRGIPAKTMATAI